MPADSVDAVATSPTGAESASGDAGATATLGAATAASTGSAGGAGTVDTTADGAAAADAAGAAAESEEEAMKRRIAYSLGRFEAPIKPEFMRPPQPSTSKRKAPEPTGSDAGGDGGGGGDQQAADATARPPWKKRKGKSTAGERKMNTKTPRPAQLCSRLAYVNECVLSTAAPPAKSCKWDHDAETFLKAKLPPIADTCPVLQAVGVCSAGLNCRYGSHIVNGKNVDRSGAVLAPGGEWAKKLPGIGYVLGEGNCFDDDIRHQLRKNQFDFTRSEEVVVAWERWSQQRKQATDAGREVEPFVGALAEAERRKVDLRNKRILAPLTTVGNLPFRRLCVRLGAEVTVGEMGLATSFIDGEQSELALLRRHESEKCFGVQVAGSDPVTMTKFAQFVDEHVDCDFVDINCGCPLDELHRKGAGSRLMQKLRMLEGIVVCMAGVLRTKALTLKMRAAHFEEKSREFNGYYAHRIVPMLEQWGVQAITIHGRSARQRYTRLADWGYIRECSTRITHGTPLIGCGDAMNWQEVEEHCQSHGVDSVMIGRGALIKPWLFTEVAERRVWDISGSERFDLMRDFVNYGLEHWGSDGRGVETTRRFLLEWLSFTCRYVPAGVLETPFNRLNWRPAAFVGRSDIETKLSSHSAKDWIELTEMLLGKVPENFTFVPKHRSNAYEPPASDAAKVAAATGSEAAPAPAAPNAASGDGGEAMAE
eukprot:NODE_1402_length_2489_cov_6.941152.p1 GENE.NODE_1402_length_2489_cov_6.941152~~NODE_1402_length_2489_cov_6.941152.p1  ORF type:complete len:770 (+),score=239.32 NODE_1402_length_2489_cov_6.941152:189-2312(+)